VTHGPETDFECYECKRLFAKTVFNLDRRFERTEFQATQNIIDVEDCEGLCCYCSEHCMRAHFPSEMAAQGVPIPQQRPDIGPIEVCAICKGMVDMAQFHLTFLLEKWEDQGWAGETLWDEYVAVVCDTCAPRGSVATNASITLSAETPESAMTNRPVETTSA
jgi:hypothetical protein